MHLSQKAGTEMYLSSLEAARERLLIVMVICRKNDSASTRKDPWLSVFPTALGHNWYVQ